MSNVTDVCPGLAAALQVVYPQVLYQRWAHKMQNIMDKVRRKDKEAVKAGAPAIDGARNRSAARDAFARFKRR